MCNFSKKKMAKSISSEKRTCIFQGPALVDKSISKFRTLIKLTISPRKKCKK